MFAVEKISLVRSVAQFGVLASHCVSPLGRNVVLTLAGVLIHLWMVILVWVTMFFWTCFTSQSVRVTGSLLIFYAKC